MSLREDPNSENLVPKAVRVVKHAAITYSPHVTHTDYENLSLVSLLSGWEPRGRRSSVIKRNEFMLSSMYWIGGSHRANIPRHLNYVRIGGGTDDSESYLRVFDKHDHLKEVKTTLKTRSFSRLLGLTRGQLSLLTLEEASNEIRWNDNANPGPTYVMGGYKKKDEAYWIARQVAETVQNRVHEGKTVHKPLYSIAGRPKLMKASKAWKKMQEGRTLGRGVLMADAHESILAGRFTVPFLKWAKASNGMICCGLNKFTEDVYSMTTDRKSVV